jgi:hypothetical protein
MMTKTLTGIVHGNTIELLTDAGLAEGVKVEVQIRIIPTPGSSKLIERAHDFSIDWTDEDDQILAEIARDRRRGYHDATDG